MGSCPRKRDVPHLDGTGTGGRRSVQSQARRPRQCRREPTSSGQPARASRAILALIMDSLSPALWPPPALWPESVARRAGAQDQGVAHRVGASARRPTDRHRRSQQAARPGRRRTLTCHPSPSSVTPGACKGKRRIDLRHVHPPGRALRGDAQLRDDLQLEPRGEESPPVWCDPCRASTTPPARRAPS